VDNDWGYVYVGTYAFTGDMFSAVSAKVRAADSIVLGSYKSGKNLCYAWKYSRRAVAEDSGHFERSGKTIPLIRLIHKLFLHDPKNNTPNTLIFFSFSDNLKRSYRSYVFIIITVLFHLLRNLMP
jgi:hypothetical protein